MPKQKLNKFLHDALKDLDTVNLKEEKSTERKVLPAAGKPSVSKKKIAKAVKETSKSKVAKPKKAPVKVKRVDEEDVIEMTSKTNLILVNPPPPVTELEKKEDSPGKTKVVIKDGIVIVQLDE